MVLKSISRGCGVRASLVLFLHYTNALKDKVLFHLFICDISFTQRTGTNPFKTHVFQGTYSLSVNASIQIDVQVGDLKLTF